MTNPQLPYSVDPPVKLHANIMQIKGGLRVGVECRMSMSVLSNYYASSWMKHSIKHTSIYRHSVYCQICNPWTGVK